MSSQWSKLEQFEQQNKVLLDFNPKGKINIHRFILKLGRKVGRKGGRKDRRKEGKKRNIKIFSLPNIHTHKHTKNSIIFLETYS